VADGGAEQVYANQRCADAASRAVAASADLAGSTCYICMSDDDAGLVRACSCRGDSGIAHLSCLVENARRSWDACVSGKDSKWLRCGVCRDLFHSEVLVALSWAAWKHFVRQPEEWNESNWHAALSGTLCNLTRSMAMIEDFASALPVAKLYLATIREDYRLQPVNDLTDDQEIREAVTSARRANIAGARALVAYCLSELEERREPLEMHLEIFEESVESDGLEDADSLYHGYILLYALVESDRVAEARALVVNRLLPAAQRALGGDDQVMIWLKGGYARTLMGGFCDVSPATVEDLTLAVTILEEMDATCRRVFGPDHPLTKKYVKSRTEAREKLARARAESGPPLRSRSRSRSRSPPRQRLQSTQELYDADEPD
jgi:hypothetical protein